MRTFFLSALLAVLVACGGDSTSPNANVTGSYTLQTVNGSSLPVVFYQDAQEKDELTAGSISLNGDHTWSGTLSVRATDPSSGATETLTEPANGTYTASNGSLTLTDASDGSQLAGTVGGGTLTLVNDIGIGVPLTLVFKR